ncbi:MAG TPA: cytochrome c biogenesis protein ResB [Pyrinomonadaceae bacterium]|nr:cytochrome c biogenesis protein ResB [Pyrinomonadaceae bacterium]
MSAVEETKQNRTLPASVAKTKASSSSSFVNSLLRLLSSVRFGIVQLILLVTACMIGMIKMQQSVEGFDKYYADLMPAEQFLYGGLGFFDIYHSWYFNTLLLVLSLNIILASIDRFPGAWIYIKKKKLEASRPYILNQKPHAEAKVENESLKQVAERLSAEARKLGMKPTLTEKDGRTYFFAERGAWNRLGAYAVHVALLTIFLGGFLTAQFGRTGQMKLMPGLTSSDMQQLNYSLDGITPVAVDLPFKIYCTDIQQKLIRADGSIDASNTLDWLTRIVITDETGQREGLVHMNAPLDYRGYRFFQASFDPQGSARNVTLKLTPQAGGEPLMVSVARGGSQTLADGTKIEFLNFFSDFTLNGNRPDNNSNDYDKPAVQLRVTTPSGEQKTVYAFQMELPDGAPVGAPFGGYKYRLMDFERVPLAHVLSIQHDPGKRIVYLGFFLLPLTLCAVFFFSHQRVWALLEEKEQGVINITLGGSTNRNRLAFEDRFKKLASTVSGEIIEVEQS